MLAIVTLAAAAPIAEGAASASNGAVAVGLDWELALKALGLLVTVVGTFIQLRHFKMTSRSSLKTDLEILGLLDASNAHYQMVRTSIDSKLLRLYAETESENPAWTTERIALIIFGAALALGFSYWTYNLSTPEFSWWSLATGYAALLGIVWIGMAVTGKGLHASDKKAAHSSSSNTRSPSPVVPEAEVNQRGL